MTGHMTHFFARLSHVWTCVQHAKGIDKSDALKVFNKDLWVPGLARHPDIKVAKKGTVQLQDVARKYRANLINDAIQALAPSTAPPDVPEALLLGPAPWRDEAPAVAIPGSGDPNKHDPEVGASTAREHPGFHDDSLSVITDFLS